MITMTSRIQNSDIISLQSAIASSLNSNENLKSFFSYKFSIYFFWCAKTAVQTCNQLKVDIKQKKENRFYKKFVTYLARVSVNYLAAANLKPRTSSFGLSYVLAKSNINFDLARIF